MTSHKLFTFYSLCSTLDFMRKHVYNLRSFLQCQLSLGGQEKRTWWVGGLCYSTIVSTCFLDRFSQRNHRRQKRAGESVAMKGWECSQPHPDGTPVGIGSMMALGTDASYSWMTQKYSELKIPLGDWNASGKKSLLCTCIVFLVNFVIFCDQIKEHVVWFTVHLFHVNSSCLYSALLS